MRARAAGNITIGALLSEWNTRFRGETLSQEDTSSLLKVAAEAYEDKLDSVHEDLEDFAACIAIFLESRQLTGFQFPPTLQRDYAASSKKGLSAQQRAGRLKLIEADWKLPVMLYYGWFDETAKFIIKLRSVCIKYQDWNVAKGMINRSLMMEEHAWIRRIENGKSMIATSTLSRICNKDAILELTPRDDMMYDEYGILKIRAQQRKKRTNSSPEQTETNSSVNQPSVEHDGTSPETARDNGTQRTDPQAACNEPEICNIPHHRPMQSQLEMANSKIAELASLRVVDRTSGQGEADYQSATDKLTAELQKVCAELEKTREDLRRLEEENSNLRKFPERFSDPQIDVMCTSCMIRPEEDEASKSNENEESREMGDRYMGEDVDLYGMYSPVPYPPSLSSSSAYTHEPVRIEDSYEDRGEEENRPQEMNEVSTHSQHKASISLETNHSLNMHDESRPGHERRPVDRAVPSTEKMPNATDGPQQEIEGLRMSSSQLLESPGADQTTPTMLELKITDLQQQLEECHRKLRSANTSSEIQRLEIDDSGNIIKRFELEVEQLERDYKQDVDLKKVNLPRLRESLAKMEVDLAASREKVHELTGQLEVKHRDLEEALQLKSIAEQRSTELTKNVKATGRNLDEAHDPQNADLQRRPEETSAHDDNTDTNECCAEQQAEGQILHIETETQSSSTGYEPSCDHPDDAIVQTLLQDINVFQDRLRPFKNMINNVRMGNATTNMNDPMATRSMLAELETQVAQLREDLNEARSKQLCYKDKLEDRSRGHVLDSIEMKELRSQHEQASREATVLLQYLISQYEISQDTSADLSSTLMETLIACKQSANKILEGKTKEIEELISAHERQLAKHDWDEKDLKDTIVAFEAGEKDILDKIAAMRRELRLSDLPVADFEEMDWIPESGPEQYMKNIGMGLRKINEEIKALFSSIIQQRNECVNRERETKKAHQTLETDFTEQARRYTRDTEDKVAQLNAMITNLQRQRHLKKSKIKTFEKRRSEMTEQAKERDDVNQKLQRRLDEKEQTLRQQDLGTKIILDEKVRLRFELNKSNDCLEVVRKIVDMLTYKHPNARKPQQEPQQGTVDETIDRAWENIGSERMFDPSSNLRNDVDLSNTLPTGRKLSKMGSNRNRGRKEQVDCLPVLGRQVKDNLVAKNGDESKIVSRVCQGLEQEVRDMATGSDEGAQSETPPEGREARSALTEAISCSSDEENSLALEVHEGPLNNHQPL